MAAALTGTRNGLEFGPFHLLEGERLLTRDGVPVELGARALDILIALTATPNEIVSKKSLMALVWPDVVVEEGSLRFHMNKLRKALGDGQGEARYITTLAGRGYCFVASVSRTGRARDQAPIVAIDFPHASIPNRLNRMVGRDEDVAGISAELKTSRFVTVVGAGGVGKTIVAIAVGHSLIEAFAGAVLFVDLGMLGNPALVPTALASMLGLSVQSDDATPSLIAYLRNKRVLLIFDTCEHLIEAVAALAAGIVDAAPQVHILATSREALRVDGEHIYRLGALACPPDDPRLTAQDVWAFPATQLFVERAAAGGMRLIVGDAEAPIVAGICRKLDGVALAIELAARRVESHGLQQTAQLLDQHLTLLWTGSRTGPPRQKTLQATLDWSFDLLTQTERVVLRRLGVFVGHFTLDGAVEVVASAGLDREAIFSAMDSLVAKSIVATSPIGAMMRYRLLDTTRAYVLEIGMDDAESAELAARHAAYYRRWLEQTGTGWPSLASGEARVPHFAAVNNVRAALEWCFGARGNAGIGVGLAVAAAPVFLAMSLLPECLRWSERAIAALDRSAPGGLDEMHLQAALGVSLMFMRGGRDAAREALERGLAIADDRGDVLDQVRLLGPLAMFHHRAGKFNTGFECAKRCSRAIAKLEDEVAISVTHSIFGISLHLRGDLKDAHAELEAALHGGSRSQRTTADYLGFDGKILAKVILGRNQWLQGYPDQAMEISRQAVADAAATDHALTLSIALLWASSVFLWAGEFQAAQAYLDSAIAIAESHSLAPYPLVAQGFKGEIAIRQGDAGSGVESLQNALQKLHAMPYELLTTALNISLIQGFAAASRFGDGIMLADQTIALVEENGDFSHMPELLRLKANLLLALARTGEAQSDFLRSLDLSRRQGARAWELRCATDLATLWAGQGRRGEARNLLGPVFAQFTEGFETPDLKAAQRLMATLH